MDDIRCPDTPAADDGQKSTGTKRNRTRFYPEHSHMDATCSTPSPENVLSPTVKPTYSLNCSLAEVLQCIHAHKSYKVHFLSRSSVVEELPKFDDITKFNLEENLEDKLWQLEAERLYDVCQRLDEPLRFKVDHVKPAWRADSVGFQQLSEIADQVSCAINICIHDNQLLHFEHDTSLFSSDKYQRAKMRITSRYDRSSENPKSTSTLPSLSPTETKGIYSALVDYMSSVAARAAIEAIPTDFWHSRALAALAKLSAKVRYLVLDLENYAHQALEDGQDLLARKEATDAVNLSHNAAMELVGTSSHAHVHTQQTNSRFQALEGFLKQGEYHENLYFLDTDAAFDWASFTLGYIANCLRLGMPGHSIDVFDMSTIVYATSWNDFTTLVHQERDGEITGTSLRTAIRTTREPFRLIHQFATEYRESHDTHGHLAEGSAPPSAEPCGAELHLEFCGNDDDSLGVGSPVSHSIHLKMSSLSDVITVLVPIAFTGPGAMNSYSSALQIVTLFSSLSNSIDTTDLPPPSFTGMVALRTQAHKQSTSKIAKADFRPVSRSLLAPGHNTRLPQHKVHSTAGPPTRKPVSLRTDALDAATGDTLPAVPGSTNLEVQKEISTWLMEENLIIVRCRRFVATALTLCAILIIGGVLVGLLLGERLPGVDPFNITTFAWVLAGFGMLVAKSIYVTEWPWKDFLQGRVPCRSVSELQMVTGIDAQDILGYLLSREAYTILITKGPFNRLFARRGTDGFSIDVKVQLETLAASGIIVVKVAGRDGPSLVCLDLRRGFFSESCTSISHFGEVDNWQSSKGCFDFPDAFREENDVPIQMLTSAVSWARIFGIYDCPKKKFR